MSYKRVLAYVDVRFLNFLDTGQNEALLGKENSAQLYGEVKKVFAFHFN